MELARLLDKFNCNRPVDPMQLEKLKEASIHLPEDYLAFLNYANGGEGFIGVTYAIFWRAEELEEMNVQYKAKEYAPELYLFGSDGGAEAFAFDQRNLSVVAVPFIGMEVEYAEPLSADFTTFLTRIFEVGIFEE
jgi:SMI1-KNR4 cell-wall